MLVRIVYSRLLHVGLICYHKPNNYIVPFCFCGGFFWIWVSEIALVFEYKRPHKILTIQILDI